MKFAIRAYATADLDLAVGASLPSGDHEAPMAAHASWRKPYKWDVRPDLARDEIGVIDVAASSLIAGRRK